MPIEVSVTDQNVQVSTSGQTVNASVSGGVGPAGPTGATGATTWAGITDKPATFAASAHASSPASAGSDPITVGTVSGRIVTTTTGGKLSTGSISDVVSGQAISPSGLTVSPPNATAGNSPGDLIPFSITYDAAAVFQINAAGDVGTNGLIEAAAFSGALDATNLTGTVQTARLATGTASASTYLRGDQTWSAISTYTLPAATTSTLGGVIVGTGLGVSSGTASVTYGTTAGTACQGDDSRLSDSRTPTSHTHAASEIASGTLSDARLSVNARSSVESFVHPFLLGGL